ncbi:MAG: hypothetical protein AABX11_07875 [Nanoarchaeota archaeon]
MKSAYNLLWISPTWKNLAKQQKIFQPIKDSILENILQITRKNPSTDVRLWIDSVRMSNLQRDWLENSLEGGTRANLSICNLRDIPTYCTEPLYQLEDFSDWRNDPEKTSTVWRQVDAAKVLIALQGDHNQSFYSDLDVIDFVVESEEVQKRLSERGIILRGLNSGEFENQLFGFGETGRDFFKSLYKKTLDYSYKGLNGYHALLDHVRTSLSKDEQEKVAYIPEFKTACLAVHPCTPGFDPSLFREIRG